jgi:hypothetical protein
LWIKLLKNGQILDELNADHNIHEKNLFPTWLISNEKSSGAYVIQIEQPLGIA